MLDKALKNKILLLLIISLSLILQLSSIDWGLVTDNPSLYGLAAFHMDEPGIAQLPVQMVLNGDLNPHWYIEPSGYLYAIFIPLSILKFFININILNAMIIGRLVSILFTVTTVLVLYLVGKEIYDEQVGLISSFLLAINPYFYFFSIFVKQDSMTVFLITSAIYFFIKYIKNEKITYYYLSLLIGGMATSTKYVAGLILFILPIMFLVKRFNTADSMRIIKQLCISVIVFSLGFVLLTPYAILSTNEFLDGAFFEFTHYSSGHEGIGPQTYFSHINVLIGLPSS